MYQKTCTRYQDEGVEEPKVVHDAIKEYRRDSDTLVRFMEECCTTSDSSVSTKDLYKTYESWCLSNSEFKQDQQQSSFTLELKRKGFNLRTGGGRKTLLDRYQLIEEEENPIFEPVQELKPVRELVLEEEEDDF